MKYWDKSTKVYVYTNCQQSCKISRKKT